MRCVVAGHEDIFRRVLEPRGRNVNTEGEPGIDWSHGMTGGRFWTMAGDDYKRFSCKSYGGTGWLTMYNVGLWSWMPLPNVRTSGKAKLSDALVESWAEHIETHDPERRREDEIAELERLHETAAGAH